MNNKFISRSDVGDKHIYQLREFKEGVTIESIRQEVGDLGLPLDNQHDMITRMQSYNDIIARLSILIAESENIHDFTDQSVPGVDTYKKNIQDAQDQVE